MVSASEIYNESGFWLTKSHSVSCPPVDFMLVYLFHSINDAIDGLDGS
jgi:hypothetical protein